MQEWFIRRHGLGKPRIYIYTDDTGVLVLDDAGYEVMDDNEEMNVGVLCDEQKLRDANECRGRNVSLRMR